MSIPYNPEDAVNTWPDGEYVATIESVTAKVSKAAALTGTVDPNMHEVILKVYPNEGGPTQKVWDYISYPKGTWKLEQIAEALGQLDAFKLKQFDLETEVGKNVSVYLRTKNDSYGAKNVVGEYLPMSAKDVTHAAKVTSDEAIDPDIPF